MWLVIALLVQSTFAHAGNVRFVTDPRGNTVKTQYDAQGRPTAVLYPANDEHPATQTSTTYDVLGRRVAMTDQEGKLTRYRYDGLGLVEVRQYLDTATAADPPARCASILRCPSKAVAALRAGSRTRSRQRHPLPRVEKRRGGQAPRS